MFVFISINDLYYTITVLTTIHVCVYLNQWPVLYHYCFNYNTCLCLSQSITCITNVIYCGLFYVQRIMMRGACSICWYWWNCWPWLFNFLFIITGYWWNCWPSLFKLSFYNYCIALHIKIFTEMKEFFGKLNVCSLVFFIFYFIARVFNGSISTPLCVCVTVQ
jgi:hypothetical protein